MRTFTLLTVLLTAIPVFAQDDTGPTAFPFSRYESLMDKSPFALATPPAVQEAPKDSFTKDWVVTGVNRLPKDAQGVELDFVTFMTRDQTQRFSLVGTAPNTDGVAIASIERSPTRGGTKVTLKKGDEFGTLGYDEMLMQQNNGAPNVPGGVQPRPGMPGAPRPGMPAGAQRPVMPGAPNMVPGNPGLNPVRQPTGNRPMIPRPNLPPQMNNGGAPYPAQPATGNPRQRIRVINSKP